MVGATEDDHHIVGSSSHETQGGRVLKDGDAFLIVDHLGEIPATGRGERGFYYRGTRFLSKLRLRFGARNPMLLCSSVLNNLLLAVDVANPEMRHADRLIPHGSVHLARRALLSEGAYLERLALSNYGSATVRVPLRIEFDADFADIFEVRGAARPRRGELVPAEVTPTAIYLAYHGLDGVTRGTELAFSRRPDGIGADEASFELELQPREELIIELAVHCWIGSRVPRPWLGYDLAARDAAHAVRQQEAGQSTIRTSNEHFNRWLERARSDLRMLVTRTECGPYAYAGVPWFSTPFGRDGIWTALQMLWLDPSLAAGALGFLSAHQATELDAEADAEPGKIIHEMRDGEMAALREVPFGRYYGSIDSTPLYLMLAAAYHEATGDLALIRRIWPNLIRAMEWVERYGDSDGDGFVEYGKRSRSGLVQQGWKDSHDSVFHQDGSSVEGPIALCEVQGYVFAALRGMAKLARAVGEPELAAGWATRAEELRTRFDAAFWCEELSTYALALDGKKRPCRVKSSNAGHCLYTGIAWPERVAPLARQLMSEEMFSGWGVRTLAMDERRYNPMSYHNGSVWPHDNAILAEGFARSGHRSEAVTLLQSFFDAASAMEFQRLPELFCGFTRLPGQEPIRYPVACLPQAWASGATFALLRAILGIETDAVSRRLTLREPVLPSCIDVLEIRQLPIGPERIDLRLVRHPEDTGVTVLDKSAPVDVLVIK